MNFPSKEYSILLSRTWNVGRRWLGRWKSFSYFNLKDVSGLELGAIRYCLRQYRPCQHAMSHFPQFSRWHFLFLWTHEKCAVHHPTSCHVSALFSPSVMALDPRFSSFYHISLPWPRWLIDWHGSWPDLVACCCRRDFEIPRHPLSERYHFFAMLVSRSPGIRSVTHLRVYQWRMMGFPEISQTRIDEFGVLVFW